MKHDTRAPSTTPAATPAPLSEADVAAWLQAHPDFFLHYPELLDTLTLPDPDDDGRTLSLLQFQIRRLRQQKAALDRDLARLVDVAHDNSLLLERLHQLHLSIVSADDPAAMVERLARDLECFFEIERVFLHSWDAPKTPVPGLIQLGVRKAWTDLFKTRLKPQKPLCGPVTDRWQKLLTHGQEETLGSLCVIPLGFRRVWGVLVLGARDDRRFSPTLDTLFLRHLGDFVSARLGPLFDDPYPYPLDEDADG